MFVRYTTGSGRQWGIRHDGEIHGLDGVASSVDIGDLTNERFVEQVQRKAAMGALKPVADDAKLLAPTQNPNKVVVVGLNFHGRVEEYDQEVPEKPILYGKATSTITNPGDPIVNPPEIEQLDYEVELALVVGKRGRRISAGDENDYLAGYTVVNDVSARDAHAEDPSAFRGNSYDTFAPLGPQLVPAGQIDPNDLRLTLSVNGEVKQDASTADFIFDVGELVEYISGVMTLYPGDVICTGTPAGAGIYREPPELLEPGDTVEARVDSIGTLENQVVAESSSSD